MFESAHFKGEGGLELARTIIAVLHAHNIAPTPRNYELWTTYHLGALPDLTRELDALIARGPPLSEDAIDALYERHLGASRLTSEVMEAAGAMARELAGTLTHMRSAAKNAGDYTTELQAASGEIEAGVDAAAFKRIVMQIGAATKNMLAHNAALEQRIDESASQIAQLQSTLQAARLEALTDALTGLANRKHFDEALARRCAEAGPLSLVMCDIDHFKRINDAFGHPVGDSVIRFVATVLKRSATGEIMPARYGGEEFAILLPDTPLATAAEWAERVRQLVRAQKPTRKSTGESLGAVTLSFGVAEKQANETAADFLARADRYLYAAKRGGRDRVASERTARAAA